MSFLTHGTIDHLLRTYGYAAVGVTVGIESLGVPFPGETMLIAAALYAGSTGHLSIWLVVVCAAAGAIIGDNIGFTIGRYGGSPLLRRFVSERRLKLGRWAFRRHGGKVVFFGRFVAILRTYAAFLAGTNRMPWPQFLAYNAAGGIVWSAAYGFAYWAFGDVLKGATTWIDIVLGSLAAALVVASLVWLRRKEGELLARAERELD